MVESLQKFEISAKDFDIWCREKRPHTLIDVRNIEELEFFSFEQAQHIPLDSLYDMVENLPGKEEPIVLVCARGRRSLKACFFLKHQGFEKLYSLSGGVAHWQVFQKERNN